MQLDPSIPLQSRGINIKPWSQSLGEAMQRQGMAQQVEAQRVEIDARREVSKNEAALRALFDRDEWPTEREIMRVVGPDRGLRIAQGLAAFGELQQQKVTDARDTAGRLAKGLRAFPETTRAEFWPTVREAAIAGGLGDAESIPETLTPEYLDGIIAWATGEERQPEKVTYGAAKQYVVDGRPIVAREGSDGGLYDLQGQRIQSAEIGFDDTAMLTGGDSDYSRYLARAARDMGKTVAELTKADEENLRRQFYAVARAPQGGSRGQGAGRAAQNPRGANAIPQGVERYIIDMRNRGYLQADALSEMFGPEVWANMQRDHPTMTAERAREAIARLIPEEGAAPLAQSPASGVPIEGAGASGGGSVRSVPASAGGAAAPSTPASGSSEDRLITVAELKAAAARLGLSEADARREYEKRGFVIR